MNTWTQLLSALKKQISGEGCLPQKIMGTWSQADLLSYFYVKSLSCLFAEVQSEHTNTWTQLLSALKKQISGEGCLPQKIMGTWSQADLLSYFYFNCLSCLFAEVQKQNSPTVARPMAARPMHIGPKIELVQNFVKFDGKNAKFSKFPKNLKIYSYELIRLRNSQILTFLVNNRNF